METDYCAIGSWGAIRTMPSIVLCAVTMASVLGPHGFREQTGRIDSFNCDDKKT